MTTMLLTALALMALSVIVSFVRVARGPTTADRVLAVDLVANTGAALMAVAAIRFDDEVFLDVSLILVASGFVSTAAFAQLLVQGSSR